MRDELYVPPRFRPSLTWLTSLDQARVDELARAINSTAGSRGEILGVLNTPDDLPRPEVLNALLSLVNFRLSQGGTAAEAAESVKAALGDDAGPANIEPLLAADRLLTHAKAADLASSYERTLENYRLITEMRPVFDEDVSRDPSSTLVVHQLELTYVKNGRVELALFSLTSEDLEQLQLQLGRAQKKEASIRRIAKASGMNVIQQKQFFA